MCGIAGLIERPARSSQADLLRDAAAMAGALIHRGPDRQGSWADEATGVALGHSRLSILDLSAAGNQPMESRGGRYALTFNGEIYNFKVLRAELVKAGHDFRGHSDTEVMLASFVEWGVEPALKRFDGMFAFALWDRELRVLYLARDRLGEKPLYYGWNGPHFIFGSELNALRALEGFKAEINRGAIDLYLRYNCIPAPYCIYEGIYKLPAGTVLKLAESQVAGSHPVLVRYWSLKETVEEARRDPFEGSDQEAVTQLDILLKNAVGLRMVSDVPLGSFLSGGIDSSLITALMQAQSSTPVRTFTIGFEEKDYNEAAHARAIAAYLGTHHSEQILTAADALKVIPQMPRIYDEPFSDSSQIATYMVARHARTSVTVCLSGDAGDEFFAGYHRHFRGEQIWSLLRRAPVGIRRPVASALRRVPVSAWQTLASWKSGVKPAIFADQMKKLIDVIPTSSHRELYLSLLAHQRGPAGLVLRSSELVSFATDPGNWPDFGNILAEYQYMDAMTYLPDDILTKVDRATMAVSLEARVPFLDPDLIRFASRLPDRMKVRGGEGKWLLRRVLERYLPAELVLKPKAGFRVPVGEWMRGPLRDWCEALLDERSLRASGFLDAPQVRRLWDEHQSGKYDHQHLLWGILVLQGWLAEGGGPRDKIVSPS